MSSFYGNIKFNNQTPLVFDKIYPSRMKMEQDCHSDGIFHGRCVLVSYDRVQHTPYHRLGQLSIQAYTSLREGHNDLYLVGSGEGANQDGFVKVTDDYEYNSQNDYYIKTPYANDDTLTFAKNKKDDLITYYHDYHNTVWQKIWTSTQDSNELEEKYIMVAHLNAETPKLTMIVDAPSDSMEINDPNNIGYFLVPTDQFELNVPGRMTKEDFENNYESLLVKTNIGFEEVSTLNLSWDIETEYYVKINNVYRKVADSEPYVDGMISKQLYEDLVDNRKITLYVSPSENVYHVANGWDPLEKYYFMRYRETHGRPHFDPIMSTDLEYFFHMPRNWKINNETNFKYNEDGFKKEKANHTRTKDNSIKLLEEKSGDYYPVHRKDEPSAGDYDEEQNLIFKQLPDRKKFDIDLRKIGDVMSEVWDTVYPKDVPSLDNSTRDIFIGNDRDRDNPNNDYPGTVAEAVRKLYYWLGLNADPERDIKGDNNFKYGPWVDPKTKTEVDTIFGVLNGAADLLGDFNDKFDIELFVPVKSPYYPDGYNQEGYLNLSDFDKLNNGGAGPLYVKVGENQYIQAIDLHPEDPDWDGYDSSIQYYRNMNSLLSLLAVWQNTVRENQGDWIFDEGHRDWVDQNPLSPRFIKNKPIVLSVDQSETPEESSINWFWKNYAL